LRADRARVDVGDPRDEIAHRAKRLVHVAREDRGREAVLDPVRHANRLVEVADADQRRRRAEDLLLGDPHLWIDVAEDRRSVVEAPVEPVPGSDLAAGQELRALVRTDLRVRVDLLERALVDDRADVRVALPAGPEPHPLGCAAAPPPPCTMFTTPFGMPASTSSSTKRSPSSGVSVAGLKTIVLPQISAGSIFHEGIAIGKFQGVIAPTTPIGTRTLMLNLSGSSD